MAQIKMLKREVKEKQRQYKALRTVLTRNSKNSFHEQTIRDQSMREMVENIVALAAERVSDSRGLAREFRREQTPSTIPRGSTRSSNAQQFPIRLPPTSPFPSPLPGEHPQGMDRPDPPLAAREVRRDINNPVGPRQRPRDKRSLPRVDISKVTRDRSIGPSTSNPAISSTGHPLTLSRNISIESSTQEHGNHGAGPSGNPDPLWPTRPPRARYRLVVRDGKMVSKKWRQPEEIVDEEDSSSLASG